MYRLKKYIFIKCFIFTFSDFMKLLNNYEMSTDVVEIVTQEELEENNLFLDAVLKTQVMKVCFYNMFLLCVILNNPIHA